MYNIALNTSTLKGKFDQPADLATKIKNALDARATAGLPNTTRYKFAYAAESDVWVPIVPGSNPPELSSLVQAVNDELRNVHGVATQDLLRVEDFVLVSLTEW